MSDFMDTTWDLPVKEKIEAASINYFTNDMALAIASWRESKGFFTPSIFEGPVGPNTVARISMADLVLSKLALVHEEVSEAVSAVRHGDWDNFVEELADAQIRIMDMAGTMGIDLDAAIKAKMLKNADRPYKHGKNS